MSDPLTAAVPYALPGLDTLLGLQIVTAGPDRVVLRWTVRPDLLQPYGILHGGVHCAAVEAAASAGAAIWYGERGKVVGVSNQTDFFRAVREGELTATAIPLHRGRSQQVWQVTVTDTDGRLTARGQVRLQNLSGDGVNRSPAGD